MSVYSLDLLEPLESFFRGLGNVDDLINIPEGARNTFTMLAEGEAPLVPYPLRNLNGSIFLKPVAQHVCISKIDITEEANVDQVKEILIFLTDLSRSLMIGFDRVLHQTRSLADYKGDSQGAIIAFGPSFFNKRYSNEKRFNFQVVPQELDYLSLVDDDKYDINAVESQADIIFMLESNRIEQLFEASDRLQEYVNNKSSLTIKQLDFASGRRDFRNHLGFYDGINNPKFYNSESTDYAHANPIDVVLVDEEKEHNSLKSGTYIAYRKYKLDLLSWQQIPVSEQESKIGITKKHGKQLNNIGSHSTNAQMIGAPGIYRRGISFVELDNNISSHGLHFISFQKSPDKFVELYNKYLISPVHKHRDKLLTHHVQVPLSSDIFFAPDHVGWQWGYVGQQFFEADKFQRLFDANDDYFAWHPEKAEQKYLHLIDDFPDFFLAYANISILYAEMDQIVNAISWSRKCIEMEPLHYLSNNNMSWALYLSGQYEEASHYARLAAEYHMSDNYRLFPYHTLGASLHQLGRFDEAEEAFHRAAARPRSEPLVFFSLGNLLDEWGRQAEALASYDACLRIANYRIEIGSLSARERYAQFNLKFIQHNSRLASQILSRVNEMIQSRKW